MPIHKENLDRINNLQQTFKDQLLWITRKNIDDASDLIDRVRDVRQFTIALSVGIIGVAFPQLLTNTLNVHILDFILISLFLFTLNIIIGLFTLFKSTLTERDEVPVVNNHYVKETMETIHKLEEIKKIENNDEAGMQFVMLKEKSHLYPMKPLNFIQRIWLRHVDSILFSLFLWGFIFLIVGLLVNLNS